MSLEIVHIYRARLQENSCQVAYRPPFGWFQQIKDSFSERKKMGRYLGTIHAKTIQGPGVGPVPVCFTRLIYFYVSLSPV